MESSKIGAFALEQKLGGPQSTVYRAMHLQQRRPVTLKLIKIPFAATDALRTEFLDEMHVLKRLAHPNIAKCFGGKIEGHQAFIASELVEGETLAAMVPRRGRLAWEQAIDIAEDICHALQAAQTADLHHHDLVPDKIIVAPDGHAKVLDFRKNRANNLLSASAHKRSAERLSYQSPEQITSTVLGAQADLYSLGCLLFFMLTGQPPFSGDAEEIARQQQDETPPRISALVLDSPVWIDALVAQLLRKNPLGRPPSAAAVLLALQEARKRAAAGVGVTQHALSGISALKMDVDKDEVRRLVGRKANRPGDDTPFYERTWFIATAMTLALAVFVAVMSWILWPLTPEQMITRADALMASREATDRYEAEHSYLRPLVEDYPETDAGRRAQEHLDIIEMERTDSLLRRRRNLGKEPENETARLYLEALDLEESGEAAEARNKLQGLITLIKPEGDDRIYVLLAQRELARLKTTSTQSADERENFINEKLAQVDALQQEGNLEEARKILTGIVSLYGDNSDYEPYMKKVQQRLAGLESNVENAGKESADESGSL